jgi:outer membrane beta-barrel protein
MRLTLALAVAMMLIPGITMAKKKTPAKSGSASYDPEDRDKAGIWEETDVLPTVQNRKFSLHHEFTVGGSHLPLDPYTKSMAVGGGYAWHLTTLWAIEGQFMWMFNYKTNVREQLELNLGQPETEFRKIKFIAQLGALFKPIYGKLAMLNRKLAYGEVYLSAYAVFAQLEGGEKTDEEPRGKGNRFAVGVAPGFGIRGFLTRHISLRFDFNWKVLFTGGFLAENSSEFEVLAPLTLTFNIAFTTRSGS